MRDAYREAEEVIKNSQAKAKALIDKIQSEEAKKEDAKEIQKSLSMLQKSIAEEKMKKHLQAKIAKAADITIKPGEKVYLKTINQDAVVLRVSQEKQELQVQAQLAEIRKQYDDLTPEQIKVIDPCCGSGHILAYLFDVLMQIYENYGYTPRDAVTSILQNNLYGLDIDDRAAQLAYFAVMMKARRYDRRFFSHTTQPHVYAIEESNRIEKPDVEYFCNGKLELKDAMHTILTQLYDAKEYGSILTITPQDWDALYARFDEVADESSFHRESIRKKLLPLVRVAQTLAQKYDVVVTNPPYMGSSGMGQNWQSMSKRITRTARATCLQCLLRFAPAWRKQMRISP
jgi:type II restriction/modification system DNA methylase subunit YeeA